MNAEQNAFLKAAAPAAQLAQKKWGVPASVTIAQAILESGWGQSSLARLANNYFGIKAVAHADPACYREFRTGEFVDGRKKSVVAKFARYASPSDCFHTHALLLSLTPRYKPAMAVKDNPSSFCSELQLCGYSTNPNYAAELRKLIAEFDLGQYDIQPDGPAAAQVAA